ncbi:MAG TPA: hypothetical protein VMZ24_01925 [Patescibacteria group bacterium]|jgi:hypothetical protein|nr:hypothetical protein [Patescibacteria group bacterium]
MDDELDSLREKSTRASSVYDDLEGEGESSGGFLSKYSPSQRLLLALLLFLDVVALACLVLVIFDFLPF